MPERSPEELSAIKRWMTKREHTALIAGVSVLLDEALDDLARLTAAQEASLAAVVPLSEEARLLDYLPRQYRARYNVRSRHLLVLWGDLELEMQGPFADEAARFAAARAIRDDSDEDGVHWLDLIELDGAITPNGGDYSGGAFPDDEVDGTGNESVDDVSSSR